MSADGCERSEGGRVPAARLRSTAAWEAACACMPPASPQHARPHTAARACFMLLSSDASTTRGGSPTAMLSYGPRSDSSP